ncbi:uncharacterized protein LOC123308072 [Coccinella septempunctata]|uniref:uncharacterized protein LOC123308072 n=1 Tax=Coccinella septempunctata TaxID=41139 RepID=UPI001D0857C8|nr:uncharacterized protein LOC123308072 [Coccinella septempunctata]
MESKIEVTKSLSKALQSKNYKIIEYEFPEIEFVGGYVAKMINVKVTVEKDGVKDLLDLLVKSSVNSSEDMFTEAYLNEIDVYSKIVSNFDKFAEERGVEKFRNLPDFYGTSITDDRFVVVLENLVPKGFKVRDLKPLDMDHLKLLLEAYAKWHAFSFALNDQKPEIFRQLGKRNIELEDWKIADATLTAFEEQIDYLLSLYEKRDRPDIVRKLRELRKSFKILMKEFLKNTNEEYLVVTHADVWNNNFLFKYNEKLEPIEVKIVDWQTAVVGSPMIDIAQLFFFCCFSQELNHMDDLLLFYHNTLSEKIKELGSNPENCFPREACLKAFKRYAALGIGGMPFLMRMQFNNIDMSHTYDLVENDSGNFSSILGDGVSDLEKFFEQVDAIFDLCIERDLL